MWGSIREYSKLNLTKNHYGGLSGQGVFTSREQKGRETFRSESDLRTIYSVFFAIIMLDIERYFFLLPFGPGRRSRARYSRTASSVVTQLRPIFLAQNTPWEASRLRCSCDSPLSLAAALSEIKSSKSGEDWSSPRGYSGIN